MFHLLIERDFESKGGRKRKRERKKDKEGRKREKKKTDKISV